MVSIVVTTKNELLHITNCLKSIKDQSYSDIEIIVVDNDSTDGTPDISRKFTHLVFNKGPERSAQRNFGAKKAKGKYVFFIDADMILDKAVVKDCVEKMENKNNSFGGIIIPEKTTGKGFWGKVKAFERGFYIGDDTIEAARFFNKSIFWECGGYNENITGPEDWDMSQKVKEKYGIGRISSFIIHDEGEARLWEYLKKKYYYGKGAAAYIKGNTLKRNWTQTIYFLRPAFYKNWKRLLSSPNLSFGLVLLLLLEQFAGLLGVMKSQIKI